MPVEEETTHLEGAVPAAIVEAPGSRNRRRLLAQTLSQGDMMPKKTFLSFRGEDEFKVWTLRGLAEFKNVSFVMDDVSLRKEIESRDDAYIRSVIRPKIQACDICLCLVGENTHRSRKWVPWEINLAADEGKEILAMRFKDTPFAITPSVLTAHGVVPFNWDVDKLFRKLGS